LDYMTIFPFDYIFFCIIFIYYVMRNYKHGWQKN
jgi:hypothetical protein